MKNAPAGPEREEVRQLEMSAACFIGGIAFGIALQRFWIATILGRFPSSMCDYCEWRRWKKKRRHKIL